MLKLLVIPGIEIEGGKCIYCISGSKEMENLYTEYSRNPEQLCSLLRRENSRSIFIRDNDSFKGGRNNSEVILQIPGAVEIPLLLSINLSSSEEYSYYLDRGYYRVMLDDLPITRPEETLKLVDQYGCSRIIFGFSGRAGKRTTSDGREITIDEFLDCIRPYKPQRLVYGDEDWNKSGIADLDYLTELNKNADCRITLLGTVFNPIQLIRLTDIAPRVIDSVIIGKPIFDNNFPCQKLWRLAESITEPGLKDRGKK